MVQVHLGPRIVGYEHGGSMKKLLLLAAAVAAAVFAIKKKNEEAKPADPWARASDEV